MFSTYEIFFQKVYLWFIKYVQNAECNNNSFKLTEKRNRRKEF